jgi:hypothetical protein
MKSFTEEGHPFFIWPEHYVEIFKLEENWEKVIDRIPV